jgi:hypothetical protein
MRPKRYYGLGPIVVWLALIGLAAWFILKYAPSVLRALQ